MRKAGEPPKTIAMPKPSMGKGYGTTAPVKLHPLPRDYLAMHFNGLDSIPGIMKWLGGNFYALTDGSPIAIGDQVISRQKEDGAPPLSNLTLIIWNPVKKTMHVVPDGRWIMHHPEDGYMIFTTDDIRARYEFEDDTQIGV